MMADNWLTIPDIAVQLGISERTIRRRIASGEYQSKTEHGKKYVLLTDDCNKWTDGKLLSAKDELIEKLSQQVEYFQGALDDAMKSIDSMVKEHAAERERTDTIILQQSNQLAQQQLMIEDMRRSPWQRLKGLLQRKSSVMSTN